MGRESATMLGRMPYGVSSDIRGYSGSYALRANRRPVPPRRHDPLPATIESWLPSYTLDCHHGKMPAVPGTLYVVATPLGNLEDLTLRALRVLREVALVACEDTRRTARLLAGARDLDARPRRTSSTTSAGRASGSSSRSAKGRDVALVSDAGTPGISDPGYRLVRDARAEGPAGGARSRGRARPSRPSRSPACPPTASSSWASCPRGADARRQALEELARPARDARLLRVARARGGGPRRHDARSGRSRRVPLPRGHQGARGVRARLAWPSCATGSPARPEVKGEVVLVVAGAARADGSRTRTRTRRPCSRRSPRRGSRGARR